MRPKLIFALALAVMTSGCDYDSGPGVVDPPGPSTVTVTSQSTDPLVSSGDTRQLLAVVRDRNGAVVPSPALSWRTSAPAVATVSGNSTGATVTAVDDGTAVISAEIGGAEGTLVVTVRRRIVSIALSGPESIVVAAGNSTQLTVVARDASGAEIRAPFPVAFASDNTFGVVVSPNGVVSALFNPWHPLTAIVTATVTADGTTRSAAKRIDIGSPAPAAFDAAALLLTESVEPNPVPGLGLGVSFFTVGGGRVEYKIVWSLLSGPPVAAHIHGPNANDGIAPILVDLPLGAQSGTFGAATGSFVGTDIRGPGGSTPISLDSLVKVLKLPASAYIDVHTERFADGEMRGPAFEAIQAPSLIERSFPRASRTR